MIDLPSLQRVVSHISVAISPPFIISSLSQLNIWIFALILNESLEKNKKCQIIPHTNILTKWYFFNIFSREALFFLAWKRYVSYVFSCILYTNLRVWNHFLLVCTLPPKYINLNYFSEAFQRAEWPMSYVVHHAQLADSILVHPVGLQTLSIVPYFMALLISLPKTHPHKKRQLIFP